MPRESKECFLEECPNNKRDRKTLEGLIVKRIRPGTRILTDGWSGYKRLEHLGWCYTHLTCSNVAIDLSLGFSWDWVNHSENFTKPGQPDVHTNEIEGKWFVVKRSLPRSGNYDLIRWQLISLNAFSPSSYLPVFLWKERMKREGKDSFRGLMMLVANRQNSDEEEATPTNSAKVAL